MGKIASTLIPKDPESGGYWLSNYAKLIETWHDVGGYKYTILLLGHFWANFERLVWAKFCFNEADFFTQYSSSIVILVL